MSQHKFERQLNWNAPLEDWTPGKHTGDRWVFAFGSGFAFPRRTIPVINYRAQPPP